MVDFRGCPACNPATGTWHQGRSARRTPLDLKRRSVGVPFDQRLLPSRHRATRIRQIDRICEVLSAVDVHTIRLRSSKDRSLPAVLGSQLYEALHASPATTSTIRRTTRRCTPFRMTCPCLKWPLFARTQLCRLEKNGPTRTRT